MSDSTKKLIKALIFAVEGETEAKDEAYAYSSNVDVINRLRGRKEAYGEIRAYIYELLGLDNDEHV